MNLRRAVRWASALLAIFVGIVLVWMTFRFIPAYISGRSLANKSNYFGAITGCVALLVSVFQFFAWLLRRGSPESIAMQLRAKTGKELDKRLADMRRTAEDIALTYKLSGNSQKTGLGGLIDTLIKQPGRVVLTGQPGVGKSYTALQVAATLIRQDPSIVPLVVPLSRWTEKEEPTAQLMRFLEAEFNVSAPSADSLLRTRKVLPIFDGLDEVCLEETSVESAADLLARLIDWRIDGIRVAFFLACRRSIWDRIDDNLKNHHSLAVFSILAVDRGEARQYLARSLSGTDRTSPADEVIRSLQRKGHSYLLANPWSLSLMAEIVRERLNRSERIAAVDLEQITDLASVDMLIAYYVESSKTPARWLYAAALRALDYWWLSNYARYLDSNRIQARVIDGSILPARDLVLHQLWPVAGDRVPRIVDLTMCVLLSAPGFYWLETFLWSRGLLAQILFVISALIWTAMLVRTSTKPWARPSAPDWTRLTDPRFFSRQLGAAVIIGVAAWLIIGPVAALICFVTAWLAIGLTVGFGQTLATDVQPKVVGPLGILRRERQVSRLSAMVAFPVLAAGFSITWGVRFGIAAALVYCLVVGETVAAALWRRYLAMIIASMFRLPLAPAHCLKRMHALGHLRIAGTSYQFRHDGLLGYFAQRRGRPKIVIRARPDP